MLRPALLSIAVLVATAIVIACSSTPTPPADPSGGGGSSSGSTSGDDDGGGTTGTRKDGAVQDAGCKGTAILDCDHLLARAESASCTAFDDKAKTAFRQECEDKNCQTPASCSTQLETLGECIGDQPATCNADGTFNGDTPDACKDDETALTTCTNGG